MSRLAGGQSALLSSHGLVLVAIARDPTLRLIDIARVAGLTERATWTIVEDLVADGMIERRRVGRRNEYTVCADTVVTHGVLAGLAVGEVLTVFAMVEALESG